jgi:hypothetical protein
VAKELVVPKDKYLIGYFTDNEVDFSIDTVFNEFMNMRGGEPGKRSPFRLSLEVFLRHIKA